MSNPFDQFDQAAPQGNPFDKFGGGSSHAGNPFDQFDHGQPAPAPPAKQPGFFDKLGNDIVGGVNSGIMNGFGGFVGRHIIDSPVGDLMTGAQQKLRQMYPGQTQEWYDQKRHQLVNESVQDLRQDAAQHLQNGGAIHAKLPVLGDVNPVSFAAQALGGVDPSYALGPGEAVLKQLPAHIAGNLLTKVAAHAAGNAVVGTAADAAYQTADQIDGLQKGWNVQRSLDAARGGALLGAGFAGLHELPAVSDHVKQMYMDRGVDTTPPADPQGRTTPLTGQGLSPEDAQQYAQVLQTAQTPKEIRDFFNGRNQQPPSFEAANEFIQRRTAKEINNPDFVPSDQTPEELTQTMMGTPDRRAAVQAHVDDLTSTWANKPDIEIINHHDEIADPDIQAQAKANDPNNDALGFLGPDNKVRLYASRIDDPDTLSAALYHESLGHYGLAQQFGDRLDDKIGVMLKRNVGQFARDTDAWQAKNPDAYGGDRIRAGEEVLANMSNNGTLKPSVADMLVSHVRQYGRKMGLDLGYSDAEVRQVLNMAHSAVLNGKGRDVRANGFRYMFTGPNAVHFSDARSFTPSDGIPRNEISDRDAKLTNDLNDHASMHYLGDVLDHKELYQEYPHLKDTVVTAYDMDKGHDGSYDHRTQGIMINKNLSPSEKRLTLLHEVQHAIQDHEGSPGVRRPLSSKVDYEAYRNQPHEKEAFATEDRANFTDTDRKIVDPPKFMRKSDLEPENIHEKAYKTLTQDYKPKYRSMADAQRMAADTAMDVSVLRSKKDGVGNLDKKLYIYDNAAKAANDKLMSMDTSKPMTDEQKADLMKTANDFHYVLGRLNNDLNQIGRALNAAKALEFSRSNIQAMMKSLHESEAGNLGALGDDDTALKFLKTYQQMVNAGNLKGASHLLGTVAKPYWWQYALSFRQGMMLSALSTHLKSTMDMFTNGARELEESALAIPGSAVRSMLKSLGVQNVKDGVTPTRLAGEMWGFTRAALEGQTYKDTYNAFKYGNGQSRYATIADPHIPIVDKVHDAISAQDTFFRSVLMNKNLYGLGIQDAIESGVKGFDQQMQHAAMIARQPSIDHVKLAKSMTDNAMLLNNSPLNTALDRMKLIKPGMNGWDQFKTFVANYTLPFIRVSSNAIMNQIIRRSPFSFLDPVTRADWAAGGARRDVAIARTLMGSALLVSYWNAAAPQKDQLTGDGPSDPNKYKELMASGWRPHAVHDGDRFNRTSNLNLSINPFDKHNAEATMVAGLREAYETGKRVDVGTGVKMALVSIMHDLAKESYVNDVNDMVSPWLDKQDAMGTKVGKFLADQAESFMPNALNQAGRMSGGTTADTRADTISGQVANAVKSDIPGLKQSLPQKYDVYGQPIKPDQSLTGVHTWVDPGNGHEEVTDPTLKELARLGKLSDKAVVTAVQRSIKINGVNLHLEPGQQDEYQKTAGQAIVDNFKYVMNSPSYSSMTDADKTEAVRSIEKDAKKQARETLVQQPGWLNAKQIEALSGTQ